MKWNEFAKEVHALAVEKGWWDTKPSFTQITVMFHSELSEAVEEYRAGRPMVWHSCSFGPSHPCGNCEIAAHFAMPENCAFYDPKPEGVAVELADCILRILDYLAVEEADIDCDLRLGMRYLPDDFIEVVAKCHTLISRAYLSRLVPTCCNYLLDCVEIIMDWATQNDVDMEAVLKAKHEYNKTRPYRHGGKKL